MSCNVLGYADMAWLWHGMANGRFFGRSNNGKVKTKHVSFKEHKFSCIYIYTIEKLKTNMFHLRGISSHIYIYKIYYEHTKF